MKAILCIIAAAALLCGCATTSTTLPSAPTTWGSINETTEAEYAAFAAPGTGGIAGQAFVGQAGGGVVKGAGATVNLDPATTIGNEWWNVQVGLWANLPPDWALTDAEKYRHAKTRMSWTMLTPPSSAFLKARRTTTADAEGRFKLTDIPAGKYYISTTVSWMVGYAYQGGLVGQQIEVTDGKTSEVMLTHRPRAN